jgi:hypothetical protein
MLVKARSGPVTSKPYGEDGSEGARSEPGAGATSQGFQSRPLRGRFGASGTGLTEPGSDTLIAVAVRDRSYPTPRSQTAEWRRLGSDFDVSAFRRFYFGVSAFLFRRFDVSAFRRFGVLVPA